ncbi:hypothetical protein DPMN_119716 [Dreissena polymorpha]|uniref:Uncharacterized protein n=1 Tax=Dreissena polymorpha TaxID=45954 RepID=A0A9D4JN07_DREPO|nr:hypothetical protein DPMN_119716 [Dreissena polymorpha]
MVTRTGNCMTDQDIIKWLLGQGIINRPVHNRAWNGYQGTVLGWLSGYQDRVLYDRPGHGMVTRTGNYLTDQEME